MPAVPGLHRSINVARRAVKERWAMPKEARNRLAAEMWDIVQTSIDVRAKTAAAKVLAELDRLCLEQEKRDLAIPDRLDVTTGGKPVEPAAVTITADDVAAARRLLGVASGDVPGDSGSEPVGSYVP